MHAVLRRFVPALLFAAAPAFAAGCATAPALDAAPAVGLLAREREVWGDVQRLEFGKRIQVQLPARICVADVSWNDFDRGSRVTTLVEALGADDATSSDVGVLHTFDGETAVERAGFEALRAAASRQRADLLLVMERTETVREGHNAAAVLKILLLPMLFLPTEDDDVELTVRAAVVDVRNGLVYATLDDHREGAVTASAASEERAVRDERRRLWAESVTSLRERMATKLRKLESAAP